LPCIDGGGEKVPSSGSENVPSGGGENVPSIGGGGENVPPIDGGGEKVASVDSDGVTLPSEGGEGASRSNHDNSEGAHAEATQQAARELRAPLRHPESARPVIEPLSGSRYRLQLTMSTETLEKLRQVQELARHAIPNGDPAVIFDRALTLYLKQLRKTRFGTTDKPRPAKPPRPDSRYIPAELSRLVYERDGYACAFPTPEGGRCNSKDCLQVDHIDPFVARGKTLLENLRVLCRAHNAYVAELYFGRETVKRGIERSRRKKRKEEKSGFTSERSDPNRGDAGPEAGPSIVLEAGEIYLAGAREPGELWWNQTREAGRRHSTALGVERRGMATPPT
jgi:hypothetical protein